MIATEYGESGSTVASGSELSGVISENEGVTHSVVITCSQDHPLKEAIICEVFTKLIVHFAKFGTVGEALLIFYDSKSHIDASTVKAANCNNIMLFYLLKSPSKSVSVL